MTTPNGISDTLWLQLVARENGVCQNCGSEEGLTPAHYVSRGRSGSDTLDNLILLCFWCHRLQHDGKLTIKKINNHFYFKRIKKWSL